MSELIAIAYFLVVPIPAHFLYLYANRHLTNLFHAISTGAVNGVSMSITDRWATLNNHYLHQIVAGALATTLLGILEVLVARTISNDAFRYFGYLHAFAVFMTVFSVTALGVLNYRYLVPILRQAEAD